MINTELLEATMQHIEDHPEQHRQIRWFTQTECGTAACFAGWACLLSGYEVSNIEGVHKFDLRDCAGDAVHHEVRRPSAFIAARSLLGLSDWDADTLFDANNTRPMLRLMVKDLVNGDRLRDADDYLDEVGE